MQWPKLTPRMFRTIRAWVITGGTDTGVMHLVGKAMHAAGVVGKVPNPDPNPNPNPDPKPNPNPNPKPNPNPYPNSTPGDVPTARQHYQQASALLRLRKADLGAARPSPAPSPSPSPQP